MPELFNTTVTADKVRQGDLLVASGDNNLESALTVKAVSRKSKYTHIDVVEQDGTLRAEHAAPFTVTRSRRTAAELEAERREYVLHRMDREERGAESDLIKAKQRLIEGMSAKYSPSSHVYEQVIEAEALVAIWRQITAEHKAVSHRLAVDGEAQVRSSHRGGDDGMVTEYTRLDALQAVARELHQDMLRDAYRWTSQSTSVFSNACDGVERAARGKFVESVLGGMGMLNLV